MVGGAGESEHPLTGGWVGGREGGGEAGVVGEVGRWVSEFFFVV